MSFDEDLQHVLETLDISPKSKESLLDQKIVSFYDLRRTRELWKSTDFGLSAPARHTLDRAIKWFDHFSEKNSRSPNMCQDYSYEAHIAFDESAIEKSVSPELQKKLLLLADRDQDCREEIEEYLAEDGVSEDEFKPESRVIRSLGPSVQKVFEKPELDEMITENLSDLTSPTDVPILSYGKTQSGKSARKYVIMCTARSMGIPSVILTKGKSEALELDRKLKGLAAGTDLANLIMPMVRKSQVEEVTIRLENAGTIVTFDSCTRVDHTRTTILSFLAKNPHKRKFVLIVDECDSFLKTEDGSTKVEQALARLRSLSPWCEFQFTATPLAVMFDKPGSKIVLRNLKPSADYVGLEMMKPLRIDGEEQWLENRRDISSKDAWHEFYSNTKESTVKIPFTNEKVMAMYDDASKNPFALLLDASSNRVRPDLEGNVFLKADLVQDHLLAQGRRIVAVVIVGAGVYFKLPVSIDGGAQHGKEETFPGAKFPKGTRVAIVVSRSLEWRATHHFCPLSSSTVVSLKYDRTTTRNFLMARSFSSKMGFTGFTFRTARIKIKIRNGLMKPYKSRSTTLWALFRHIPHRSEMCFNFSTTEKPRRRRQFFALAMPSFSGESRFGAILAYPRT